jgi:hypothetical protein
VLPGEVLRVFVLKEGKESGQGVAYLDDGTMVVVDQGKRAIGRTIEVTVTSVLQTTAGKMIFCRWPEANAPAPPSESDGRREGREGRDRRDPRSGRDYRGEPRRESDRREAAERHPAPEPSRPEGGSGPAAPHAGNGPTARG